MKNVKLPLILHLTIFLFCSILFSCNVAYLPSMQNVPLISQEGEATASISGSNFQGAGAINSKFALMGNFQYSLLMARAGSDNDYGVFDSPPNQWNLEIAPGLHKTLSPNVIFEIYGGAGIGGCNVFGDDPIERYHANAYRFFIQPDIGYKGEKWEFAGSVRILKLQYFNVVRHNISTQWLEDYKVLGLDEASFMFIEPALTLRYAFSDNVQAFGQLIYSEKITNHDLRYMPGTLILGISGRF